MMIENPFKIDVNALFGLKPRSASPAELAAEKLQQDYGLLTMVNKNAYRENIVREGLVESLQAYNRIVGAKQSVAIANLANPFVRAPDIASQLKVIMTDIQRDILVNAKNQAKALAEKSESAFGFSLKDRHELQVHFIEVFKKMDAALVEFDAGNADLAFRIYADALGDNIGYIAWLSRELCQNGMSKTQVKIGESDDADLCDEFWRSNIGGGLSVCNMGDIDEKSQNGISRCAIFNFQKLFVPVLPVELLAVKSDHNTEEKALETVPQGSTQENKKIVFDFADSDYRLAHYCSCDYYFGVCETKSANKETACACDPDCKVDGQRDVLKNACVADDHCDSWCPLLVDPDCVQAGLFAIGALSVEAKRKVPKPEFVYDEPEEVLPTPAPRPSFEVSSPDHSRLTLTNRPVCTMKCIQIIEQNCGWTHYGYNGGSYYCNPAPRQDCRQVCE